MMILDFFYNRIRLVCISLLSALCKLDVQELKNENNRIADLNKELQVAVDFLQKALSSYRDQNDKLVFEFDKVIRRNHELENGIEEMKRILNPPAKQVNVEEAGVLEQWLAGEEV